MLTVNELFSGIGSQRAALERLGIEHKVVGIAEIDKFAIKSYEAIWGETKNYGDISKVDKLDYADFWTYSFPCFTKDNYVLTDKGYKTIDKIETGDKVLTHNNTYEKVINVFNNGIRDTVKVKGQCIDEIITTKNHRFYVRERYRKWDNQKRSYDRLFKEPEWLEIGKVTKDYYLGVAINQESIIPKWDGIDLEWSDGRKTRHKNELQPLMTDKRFWWLTGKYIADGWTRTQSGIVIAIGKHKLDEFIANIGDIFNYNIVEERTAYKCHIPLKELEKFVSQFGKGAINKKITNTIIDLPINLLKSFLDGYISGDGYYNEKDGRYKCSSISRQLLIGLGQCVAKVYKTPYSMYKTKRLKKTEIEGRIVNQHDTYELTFKKDIRKQDNAFYEDGYVWYPFQGIKENGKEEVFDIEVENAHSFTVQNTIVHNCQDISVAGKLKGIEQGKTRSGLLYEVERLLEVAQEHDELPKYLMLENVKNLVGKKFKPQFEEWIERLDELGYNTKWQILNSKHYGIPQNRERVFGISIRKDIDTGYVFPEPFELKARLKDILEDEVDEKFYISQEKTEKLISQIKLNNPSIKREPGKADGVYTNQSLSFTRPPLKDLSRTLKAKVHDAAVVMPIDKSYNNPKPIEIANCITAREDRGISNRKSEGTAVIEPIIVASRGRNPNNPSDRTAGSPTEQRLEINQKGTSNTITTVQKDNYVLEPIVCEQRTDEGLRFFKGGVCGALRTIDSCGDKRVLEPQIQKIDIPQTVTVRKHPVDCKLLCECLRDHKFASNFSNKEIASALDKPITLVEHWFRNDNCFSIPDADIWFKLKELLNITTDEFDLPITEFIQQEGVYEKANRCYMVDGISPTITSASADEKIIEDYCIRKLTPKECWRLMGFADEQFQKAEEVNSNSQLYKQAGNSIVVDVLYYIFRNLFIEKPKYRVQVDSEEQIPGQSSILDFM